jgi:hypothetical protein
MSPADGAYRPTPVTALPTGCPQREDDTVTAHQEIREVARALASHAPADEFVLADVIAEMRARGSRYDDSTIRTHVTSRMCANAPDHHAVVYRDFWCVDRGSGRYRLCRPGVDETERE